jgi:type II secretory pathway pseudopilin PulG
MKSFTLIETIVTIFIFTLAMGAVSGLIVMAYRTQSYSWQQSIAIDEARRGIETMVKEIRMAKEGEDGSYPIELAGDKECIFYSDIDKDGRVERVRYFLAQTNSGTLTQECQTSQKGGSCSVLFSNFLTPGGVLKSANVSVLVDGDFGSATEYAEIFADGTKIGEICKSGCKDCLGSWQGTQTFDVKNFASDNSISFLADATNYVDPSCPFSMKAKFIFSFAEDISALSHEFKKGIIEPTGSPPAYPLDQEKITTLTSYVRNTPPIFEYFDQNGNKILDYPARLKETKVMKVYLVVNVDPNRPPQDFELESYVQLRNLKEE